MVCPAGDFLASLSVFVCLFVCILHFLGVCVCVVRYFVVGSPRVGTPDDDDYDDDEDDVDLFDSCLWYALTSISPAFRFPKPTGPFTAL